MCPASTGGVALVHHDHLEIRAGLPVEGVERPRKAVRTVARGDRHGEKGSHGANIIARMARELQSAQVALVSLEAPLEPIEVENGRDHAVLVVTLGGAVLGEVAIPVRAVLGIETQREEIERQLGERVWKERLAADFTRPARAPAIPAE